MQSFDRLLSLLSEIPDPRRAEGKIYKLPHVTTVRSNANEPVRGAKPRARTCSITEGKPAE